MSKELDARVAREVMGLELDEDEWCFEPSANGGLVYPLPNYSGDLTTAWLVIARMAELGYWCEMRTSFVKAAANDCWAGFTPHSTARWNGRPDNWTRAETLEAAICLAALATVAAERDE